jgi:hypothetical protein
MGPIRVNRQSPAGSPHRIFPLPLFAKTSGLLRWAKVPMTEDTCHTPETASREKHAGSLKAALKTQQPLEL